ncbi:Multicopper oxidase [hydrothermal vent metagenome]|uniref:Multicopper oxidase n=1 Tax=hydrothermal vent metagenome TaxID=652676 RepID=A0A3B0R7N2_9ZZZZ
MLDVDRRKLLTSSLSVGGVAGLSMAMPAWARGTSGGTLARKGSDVLSGEYIKMLVTNTHFNVDGRTGKTVSVNGTLPGPLIRLKEGQKFVADIVNRTDEDTSVHWHGLLLPFEMDGVPGVTFPGIKSGETWRAEFPIRQAGTYWWHAHSLQEALGHYGPIIIDPEGPDPIAYDREYVIVLSDWSPMDPHTIIKKLKQQGDYFNYQRNTLTGLLSGKDMSLDDKLMWGNMRMSPNDLSDVTGSTYTYLINGHGPGENWTGLFKRGERVRLRFVNAAAMSIFNIRIPGLPMTVVQADGQNVKPVAVDEFQISVAETYDVIITPEEDRAFGLVAEAIDRSGMAFGTLAPRAGMTAPKPELRKRVLLTMKDMGMDHGAPAGSSTGTTGHEGHDMSGGNGNNTASDGGMDHSKMDMGAATKIDHGDMAMGDGEMNMNMRDKSLVGPDVKVGVGNASIAPMPFDGMASRPLGLRDEKHRVLVYTDLVSLVPNENRRPTRMKEIHLTANMERYMWSFDGKNYSSVTDKPIRFAYNERVRV